MRQAFASVLIFSTCLIGTPDAAPILKQGPSVTLAEAPLWPGLALPRSAADAVSGNPGVTKPLVATPKSAAPPPQALSDSERIDGLFQQLAHATDADEADGLAHAIERLWLRSGSDTADLLMERAVAALAKGNTDTSMQLLDRIVVVDPDWAEAWNKRATLRFLKNDDIGAMQDIAHVLAIEPRHFGALSGMTFILHRDGMDKQALALIRRTEAIYPHNSELEKLEAELSLTVEGRGI